MRTKIVKWGNSLGLRIPRSFAAEVRVGPGSLVDLSVADGSLRVRPVHPRKYRLAELLKGVNARNLHREVATGRAVGREVS